jgi:S1-C subfamily serine protease
VRKTRPRTVADFSASKRLPEDACVHCHQVNELRRESLQAAGKWRLDEVWAYPLPENVGITLDVDVGDQVKEVKGGSPAERAGLRRGDRLTEVNGLPVASFADVQYALHRATNGKLELAWQRGGKTITGRLVLREGWRKTDVSWRWSLRGLDPASQVDGEDLTAARKKALGLPPTRLAFRQNSFVSEAARQAGIQPGDVIVGVDGKQLHLTVRQFAAHVRLTYRVGDRVTYNLLRDGKAIDVTLTLRGR